MNVKSIKEAKQYFVNAGYDVGERSIFSNHSLYIGKKCKTQSGISVLNNAVFLYLEGCDWIVRKTPHGKEHIIHQCNSFEEAAAICTRNYLEINEETTSNQ